MKNYITIGIYVIAIPVAFCIQYILASYGEPRALWFMQLMGFFLP